VNLHSSTLVGNVAKKSFNMSLIPDFSDSLYLKCN
jgi:hypothetical protein